MSFKLFRKGKKKGPTKLVPSIGRSRTLHDSVTQMSSAENGKTEEEEILGAYQSREIGKLEARLFTQTQGHRNPSVVSTEIVSIDEDGPRISQIYRPISTVIPEDVSMMDLDDDWASELKEGSSSEIENRAEKLKKKGHGPRSGLRAKAEKNGGVSRMRKGSMKSNITEITLDTLPPPPGYDVDAREAKPKLRQLSPEDEDFQMYWNMVYYLRTSGIPSTLIENKLRSYGIDPGKNILIHALNLICPRCFLRQGSSVTIRS